MNELTSGAAPRLIGYFPAWGIHAMNYCVEDVPAGQLTHLIYAFANITPNGDCVSINEADDKQNFPALADLKKKNPGLQVLISIGGASHSANFSPVVADDAKCGHCVASCVGFMKQNGFDGIDIDWETPANDQDRQRFTGFLAELRKELDALGSADNRHYLLTIAAPAGPQRFANIDLKLIHPYLDWINLMAYDFYVASSKVAGLIAPLHAPSDDQSTNRQVYNVDAAVRAYLAAGVPPDKLVLGVRFFGTGWQGVPNTNNGLFQKDTGPAKGTWGDGAFGYADLEANYLPTYTRFWHPDGQVPWLYKADAGTLISYEDPQSLAAKAGYMLENSLGGIMIWNLAADDQQHTLLNALTGALGSGSTGGPYTVQGHVLAPDGSPLAGVTVTAADADLRGEQALGRATTDKAGQYLIRYTARQFAAAEKGTADLIVRVLNADGKALATAPTLFNAPANATIDVVVRTGGPGVPSEYEGLVSELTPLLANVHPANVSEPTVIDRLADLGPDDISFLVQETGEQIARLQFLAASAVLQKQALAHDLSIPAAAFYGMAREGLPIDAAGLPATTVGQKQSALAQAIQDGIIPAALADGLDQLCQRIQQFASLSAVNTPPPSGKQSLGQLLNTAGLNATQQTALVSLAAAHAGSPQTFWSELRKQPAFSGPGVVEKAQLTLQLGLLTGHHLPLVQALQGDGKLTSLRSLVAMDRPAWFALLAQQVGGKPVGVPPGVPGASPQAQAVNYVNSIVASLQAAFPTDAVAAIASRQPALPAQKEVGLFFANSPDFDVRTTQVDSYAAAHAGTAFKGIAQQDQPTVVAQVKRLQRVYQLSTNGDTMAALLNTGLDSAHHIANIPLPSFIAQHALALGGEAAATQIYQRAQLINARSLNLFSTINEALNGAHPAALGDGSQAARQDLIQRFPNYTDLFGSLDFCNCSECQGVLSAAAYLVDLLQFLGKSTPNSQGNTPLDILIGKPGGDGGWMVAGRRPDLANLPLTCENTNTPMPYLDLVNEVLESYVNYLASGSKNNPSIIAYDNGDATQAELDANPQDTSESAYAVLDAALYPFTLPFNWPVVEARAFLANQGSSRYEVLSTFARGPAAITTRATAAEWLGITREEYQILTGADFDPSVTVPAQPLNLFYGYPNGTPNWEKDVCQAQHFIDRTGIAYDDLVTLLQTAFINPAYPQGQALDLFQRIPFSYATLEALVASNFANPSQAVLDALNNAGISLADLQSWCSANFAPLAKLIVLDSPDGSCDVAAANLVHLDGSQLGDPELSKLQRFIRTWRTLGWSIPDLDRALAALAATDITPDVVTALAQLGQLQGKLNPKSLQVLCAFYAPINARGDGSLYAQLFLSKAASTDPAFRPNPDGSVLTSLLQSISGHTPALLAAFRLSAADLAAIRTDAGLVDKPAPPIMAPLTLANVSKLYRYVALAQGLRLRVTDMISLKTLSGLDPFASPAQTLQFTALAAAVQASGFSITQLNYLYRQLSVAPAGLAPQGTAILLLAATLRAGLNQITTDNTIVPDPNGDFSRTRLALLFDGGTVDQAIGLINGTTVYTAPLAALPASIALKNAASQVIGIDPAKMPAAVAGKVSYSPAAAQLRFQGAMTTAEQAALLNPLPGPITDPAYQAAVNDLFAQPVTFIRNALTGFLDLTDATAQLVRNIPTLDGNLNPVLLDANGQVTTDPTKVVSTAAAAKFAYLLGKLLPYLITQLSHSLAKQTIATALALDTATAQYLLETACHAASDSSQPAIADLLALGTPGLTGSYFTAPDLTGSPATVRTDASVDFDGAATLMPAGARSVRWTGMLAAPNNGAYAFAVVTNGTPQLWLGEGAAPLALTFDSTTGAWLSQPDAQQAGQLYSLRLEITALPATAPAAHLFWQSAAQPKSIVSPAALYPEAQLDAFTATFTRLQMAALLTNTFGLSAGEITYFSTHGAAFGGFDLNALPLARANAQAVDQAAPALFASWQRLNAYVTLRNSLPGGPVTLIDVFGAADLATAQARLAQATGWDSSVIAALAGPQGFNLALADFQTEVAPARLAACVALINRLGASASQLFAWAGPLATFAQLATIAGDIVQTVRAAYDAGTWPAVAKSINDPLRQARRDALVAYLLPQLSMDDPNQLFEFFLIDAEMNACMETSRVVQAISSVQLFVDRCLLNLEARLDRPELSVSPSAIDGTMWNTWLNQYRVWQANREVFLYPENWLDPTLRGDATPFFATLQGDLLQNELTSDNVETAFLTYLRSLDQVARLEICGEYWEANDPDTGELLNTLHVFGRTPQAPHVYFYRQLQNTCEWTAWEQMTIDIQGDFLIPIIWNRRLFLFWATFATQAQTPPNQSASATSSIPVNAPNHYYEITLSWSEYWQGKWQPKQVANDTMDLDPALFGDLSNFFFRTDGTSLPGHLLIHCEYHDAGWDYDPDYGQFYYDYGVKVVGTFDLSGCTGDTVAVYVPNVNTVPDYQPVVPAGANIDEMMFSGQSGLTMTGQDAQQALTYLYNSPSAYRLLYPHQYGQYTLQAPFFYQDAQRTFFAQPVEAWIFVSAFSDGNLIDVGQYAASLGGALSGLAGAPGLPAAGTAVGLPILRQGVAAGLQRAAVTMGAPGAAAAVAAPVTATVGARTPHAILARGAGGLAGQAAATSGGAGNGAGGNGAAASGIGAGGVTAGGSVASGAGLRPAGAVHIGPVAVEPVVPAPSALAAVSPSALAPGNWAAVISAAGFNWWVPPPMGWFQPVTDLVFQAHYHAFVCDFMKSLTRLGVPGLMATSDQTLGIPYLDSPWQRATWGTVTAIANNVTGPARIIQGDFGVPGSPMNFEAVVLQGSKLVHYWRDNSNLAAPWQAAEVITDKATGPGWLIQSDWMDNGHGHLEVIVPEGSNLVHYWIDNTNLANRTWNKDPNPISKAASGPGCFIQSDYYSNGHGIFQVVVLEGTNLVRYFNDNNTGIWTAAEVITNKATSAGCIIQSDYYTGENGHYEVVVCEGANLVHYRYDGSTWQAAEVVTDQATGGACLIQSDIRDGRHGNFEVVVPEAGQLVHYWLDNSASEPAWQQGQVVSAGSTGPGCIIQSTFGMDQTLHFYGNFEVAALERGNLVHYWNTNNNRFFFALQYQPTQNVGEPYPVEDVDFAYGGAYATYNWELFYHAPLMIAEKLTQDQRFSDAMTWLKYIFDPTDDSPNEPAPSRYWKTLPLKNTPRESLQDFMLRLDAGDPQLIQQVNDWAQHPFDPQRIARMRPGAFAKNVFMKFLDNLIAWGDQLFAQDTIESINEAEQLYVLAADLLGPLPTTLPDRGQPAAQTYASLRGKLDAFSNALVQIENQFPFSSGVSSDSQGQADGLLGLGATLYFCIPQNDQLLAYWSTVADRLFKIRNCMNLQGIVQHLPLFAPPINPALLVQAAAMGVDLGSVLSDLNGPLPNYRFTYMIGKALELCAMVRELGSELLSALEKRDAEKLALMRAQQETGILNLMKSIKQQQIDDANAQVVALQAQRNVPVTRYGYYQLLLNGAAGTVPDLQLPECGQTASPPSIAPAPVPSQPSQVSDGGTRLLLQEQDELDLSHLARDLQSQAANIEILANVLAYLPDLEIAVEPFGAGTALTWGSKNLVAALSAMARQLSDFSAQASYDASHAGKMAGYFRRQQEWTLQSNLAAAEIAQIDRQTIAAQIRACIANQELGVHLQQIQNAQDAQDYLTNKYTNQELYSWLISDISATYFQCYQLAYDLAKKAERAYRFERGLTDSNYIQFGYWDSLRSGLQAGQRLYLALKQLEGAYQDQNVREYEITRHVSLQLADPLALIQLKATGTCEIDLPETFFDADYPGHYMRRLRTVGVTIPAVVGPYTSINCTLTLLGNKTRINSLLGSNGYPEDIQNGDSRFVANFAPMEAIATSNAQADSGLFELSFRDERYLPFEGAGAISRWRIDMPLANNAFDFSTISDVVLHLRYTAREGGDALRSAARSNLQQIIGDAGSSTLARLFSLKHEFPTDWYRFLNPVDATATTQSIALNVTQDRFPFQYRGAKINVVGAQLFLSLKPGYAYDENSAALRFSLSLDPSGTPEFRAKGSPAAGLPFYSADLSASPTPMPGAVTLSVDDATLPATAPSATSWWIQVTTNGTKHVRLNPQAVDDIFLVCSYTVQ